MGKIKNLDEAIREGYTGIVGGMTVVLRHQTRENDYVAKNYDGSYSKIDLRKVDISLVGGMKDE